MEKQVYITEGERVKCQKVADAFTELYEMSDVVVVEVGRYGFVMLKYYMPPHGFEDSITFIDSVTLFESLSEEKQSEVIARKAAFTKAAKIYL